MYKHRTTRRRRRIVSNCVFFVGTDFLENILILVDQHNCQFESWFYGVTINLIQSLSPGKFHLSLMTSGSSAIWVMTSRLGLTTTRSGVGKSSCTGLGIGDADRNREGVDGG